MGSGQIGGSPPRYGKHRGKVLNNLDPEGRGRLLVSVPEVYGTAGGNWALPCVPFAGDGTGMLLLPAIHADVWVEFEQGDINHPIWAGCFWGQGKAPATLETEKVIKTTTAEIRIDEAQNAILVSSPASGEIRIEQGGLKISTPQGARIELQGNLVKLNGDGLEVM